MFKKKIVLDLETTGLYPEEGDKIIEICCLNLRYRKITNKIFHYYLNPRKKINKDAYSIHGISDDFLLNKPFFSDIVLGLLSFVHNSDVIIHNSDFDLSFLNLELMLLGFKKFSCYCNKIIDTLTISRNLFPRKRNSLEALCKRFNINSLKYRKFHSALLDVVLLSKVYLIITRKQIKLMFNKIY